ncbi:cytochrome C family protein [Geobacter metallireducens RCH3]|uniref:Lipoprotein cytochrome c n=1 Tax=Geobacter metallireducens (strain ATCC 53774 / DSM 7210 / GS-15) TaxID=269799 RepID=Q39Y50_GEOMG|nr:MULTISPECIES: CxxxxCH/CxxCH domain-containing protein [Geobacter]ABB30824.2 lipoprotein cytochrome c [Geobacter metallireducens GS-15]EHP88237.1 cytochrome C family protein [Geobacter metallireducens RCH3]MBT1075395.1 CxxxxCH/CxxCH domain-containing protein [Geobacter grbiciae]
MGTTIARQIRSMGLRTKIGIIVMLVVGCFLYQIMFKPMIGDTATQTYYFTTDSTSVNLGADGSTSTAASLGGKISMKVGVYAFSRSVSAASNTSEQRMISAYGPVYAAKQTINAPAVTIGVRDRNGTANAIYWKAYVYAYNPAVAPGTGNPTATGAANNARLLWTSDEMEAHPSVQTPLDMTFTNPALQTIDAGQRIKVVITARLASTASSARLFWGGGSNYSFFTVTEAPYVADSVTVSNLADYYAGGLTSVTQGDTNVPMLRFDLYTNVAGGVNWSGGLLDKIGTNTSVLNPLLPVDEPGDVSFSIYRDADNDGVFEPTDTLIGGPYNFSQLTKQGYSLPTPEALTATPRRYFITYTIRKNATYNTTVGARIVDGSYFTVDAAATNGVRNVTSTSSSTPLIQYGGTPVVKNYAADWDAGTSLTNIAETGGPGSTTSTCITRTTAGSAFPLVGLLNYPNHSCASVAGQNYSNTSGSTQPDFVRLYFSGDGYHSDMLSIKGRSFTYRLYTPSGGGTVTLQMFYVTSGGVRVNAPIASTYKSTGTLSQTITTSLSGQDFSNVPLGARLGIQIGVTANAQIGLGGAVGAQLQVEETAALNENVDVGDGFPSVNANVYAGDTSKVIDSFTLSASKAKTVSSISIKGNPLFNSTNIKNVWIYQDNSTGGMLGALDGTDTLIGSTSVITGNVATVSVGSLAIDNKTKRFLVVVDIGDTPNTNVILNALVSDLAVVTSGTIGENSDSSSANLTILPTTTVSGGTAEPPGVIVPSGAGATKLDAFNLATNGGVNDTFSSVTVTLSTTSTLPAGKVISDYVARLDIIKADGTSFGHLTSPTQVNNWQVTTTGLAATTTPTDYYVAVTPKAGQGITYDVKAQVVSVVHSRTTNRLLLSDPSSATVIMDQQPPTDPTLTVATGTYHNDIDRAEINLNWTTATDTSGSAVSYVVVRGLGNAPPPRNCTVDNVKTFPVYSGTGTSLIDKNLDEGISYGYRACAVDSVNNVSVGTAGSAIASIKNRCTELPSLEINPNASYIKAGNTLGLDVAITSNDTGVCAATTYTLSIVGTDIDDSNYTVSTFSGNNFIIPTMGSQYTKLNITAKPGAVQGAVKTFQVKVAKSSGGETLHADPVYVTVNKYGTMMHSSLQLGTTKYGIWGKNYDCATCHSPTATNIKQVKNSIATPTGNRPVVFNILSTASSANVAGVFGNDHRSGTATTNVCEVCHHNARFHQYSSSKVTWKDHNNNEDCMKCHSHKLGFKTVAQAGSCTDCHGYPPTIKEQLVVPTTNVLSSYATNAGSHGKHNDRGLKCQACHSNGNHLVTAVPDKNINMGFKVNGTSFPGWFGQYTTGIMRSLTPRNGYTFATAPGTTVQQAPGTIINCNVYCHGWDGNGGYNTDPAWTGISQVGCGSCHAATNDQPPTSGSHHKHASNEPGFGNGIACSKCHGFRNYSTSSAHINGNVEWDLSTLPPGTFGLALYRGVDKGNTGAPAPTPPGSYGSCSNLYCHSNVQSNNGTGPPTSYSTPTWGGTTTCNSCHQAQPNVTGGHPQHAGAGVTGFDCRICHGNGGDANPLNHANDYINFQFGGLAENTHYSYSSAKVPGSASYGTCYNGNCHGLRRPKTGPTALTWGPANDAIPLCDKCHTTDPSLKNGFYSTMGPNGTTSNTDPYVGAHFQHITSMPFKLSSQYDCSECHNKPTGPYTPGHIDSQLPAELTFGATASSGAVLTGYTSAQHQPGYNYGAHQCSNIWCHGSGMDSVEGTGLYGSAVSDGATPNASRIASPVWNAPFLNGTTADCNKCHASPPPAPLPGYNHWDDDNSRPYQANQCINCHKHVNAAGNGFTKPEIHANGVVDSCLTCHGLPPTDNSMTNPPINALSAGMTGAHQGHFLNPNIGKRCTFCHYNNSGDMPSYKLEIGFNAFGGKVRRGTFYGYSTLTNSYSQPIVYFATITSTTVRRTTNTAKLNTCENVYCHGGGSGAALPPLGGGSNTKPDWELGYTEATCGSCHGVTGETYRTRGSHGAHVGTLFGEPKLACSNCHGVKENNYHVNGQVEWEFYTSAKRMNQIAVNDSFKDSLGNVVVPGYKAAGASSFAAKGGTGNLAPSAAYGTCQVYCHSDVYDHQFKAITWGSGATTCNSCHRDQTSAGRYTGAHQKHTASSANGGYGIDCVMCHYGSGAGNPLHVNGTVDIIFNSSVVGPNGVYAPGATEGTGTCKNILCHVSDATTGPAWNGGSASGSYATGTNKPTCIGCHSGEVGGRTAVIPQFAGASHHVQGVTMSATYCYPCHMEANADGTANATYHDRTTGKSVDLVLYGNGTRGTVFTRYTAAGSATRKRTEYAKINNVCIGCHSTKNNATTPFSASGDTRTPKTYAWDNSSIFNRYSSTATTLWGKVTGNDTVKKGLNKAFSAHGNASGNQRGWAFGSYTGGPKHSNTSGAVNNVLCFDCHNSHGTVASGIMTSYSSATGRYSGGMLKTTVQGVGGYNSTYAPVAGGDSAAPNRNAYNTGASLCFDCHNNKTSNTSMPWGYNDTFGSNQPIYGFHDKPYFGNYSTFAMTVTYPYKASNPGNKGGHYGPSSPLTTAVTQRTFANGIKDNPYSAGVSSPINGLCTPCHDPHGVSKNTTYVSDRNYGVPLLKGTWVTSPYRQDSAPRNTNEARGGSTHSSSYVPITVGSTPRYFIDQNSMQAGTVGEPTTARSWTFTTSAATLQTTADTQFAGLCTGCHNKSVLNNTAAVTGAPGSTGSWKAMTRIHNTVDGWALTTGSGGNVSNKVHAFTCSKCHTPHNARLPRLMVTNCLDAKHRGGVAAGGNPVEYSKWYQSGAGKGRFPVGGGGFKSRGSAINPGTWFFGKSQSTVQNAAPALTLTTQTQCHNTATAGGITYTNYTTQHWNNKTPW